jgi:hypothetical protein
MVPTVHIASYSYIVKSSQFFLVACQISTFCRLNLSWNHTSERSWPRCGALSLMQAGALERWLGIWPTIGVVVKVWEWQFDHAQSNSNDLSTFKQQTCGFDYFKSGFLPAKRGILSHIGVDPSHKTLWSADSRAENKASTGPRIPGASWWCWWFWWWRLRHVWC